MEKNFFIFNKNDDKKNVSSEYFFHNKWNSSDILYYYSLQNLVSNQSELIAYYSLKINSIDNLKYVIDFFSLEIIDYYISEIFKFLELNKDSKENLDKPINIDWFAQKIK